MSWLPLNSTLACLQSSTNQPQTQIPLQPVLHKMLPYLSNGVSKQCHNKNLTFSQQ